MLRKLEEEKGDLDYFKKNWPRLSSLGISSYIYYNKKQNNMEFYPGFEQETKRRYKKQNTMATSTSLTNLELQAIKAITESDFYENGRESVVWDFSAYDNLPFKGKKRSGVFSSLVQKGLIFVQEKEKPYYTTADGQKVRNPYYSRDCNFGTIYITKEGYQLLDEMNLIDEYGRFKVTENC